MDPMKCKICGGAEVIKQGDYYECQYCGVKFKVEENQRKYVSVKIDKSDETKDTFNAGFTALENEDWRSAASFFKKVLDVNPLDAQAFHYYKYSSDMCYLSSGDKVMSRVRNLIREIGKKMATIIDMYMEENKKKSEAAKEEKPNDGDTDDSDEEWTIDDSILESIDDFDDLANRIAAALTKQFVDSFDRLTDSQFSEAEKKNKGYMCELEEAYGATRIKLEDYYDNESEVIASLEEHHNIFIENWDCWFKPKEDQNEETDQTQNTYSDPPVQTRYAYSDPPPVPPEDLMTSSGRMPGQASDSSTRYRSHRSVGISAGGIFRGIGRGIARFFGFIFDEDVLEVIAKAIAFISSAVFLVLAILSISRGESLILILFQAYVAITSMVATKRLFDGFGGGESIAIVINALFQVALAYFAAWDMGFNLGIVWRILIWLALSIFGYAILNKIRY